MWPRRRYSRRLRALGPLYWLGHNWWCCSNVLDFYNGPYSPRAIQGAAHYPGLGDWGKAWLYFRTAARWFAGTPLLWLGAAGLLACAAFRKARWPALLLLLPAVFYVWSMHSSGTPIFVPDLWPNSYYNTRYGLALFPALALGAAALAALVPARARPAAAVAVAAIAAAPWLAHPRPEAWITWKESQVNSVARRAWTRQAADFLAPALPRRIGHPHHIRRYHRHLPAGRHPAARYADLGQLAALASGDSAARPVLMGGVGRGDEWRPCAVGPAARRT